MAILPILSGETCSLWWVAGDSDRFHAQDYFDHLTAPEKAKFTALFERMARDGRIVNEELFRRESGNIHCFKRGQHRLACFREGTDLLLTNGFRKKRDKDKRLKRHIEMAERIRTEYLNQNVKE
jgi:hypothetical protein